MLTPPAGAAAVSVTVADNVEPETIDDAGSVSDFTYTGLVVRADVVDAIAMAWTDVVPFSVELPSEALTAATGDPENGACEMVFPPHPTRIATIINMTLAKLNERVRVIDAVRESVNRKKARYPRKVTSTTHLIKKFLGSVAEAMFQRCAFVWPTRNVNVVDFSTRGNE
jgi:hypothetical protein